MLFETPRDTDALFEQLFSAFPQKRKGTRRMALPAWRSAIRREAPEVILAGAVAYAASEPGEYSKGLPAWLNGDCWAIDYTPPTIKADKSVIKAKYFDLRKQYQKPYHGWMTKEMIEEMFKYEKELAG